MSGAMAHGVDDIVLQFLMDRGIVGDAEVDPLPMWPGYSNTEQDNPDEAVFVQETAGRTFESNHVNGIMTEHLGIQVKVRGRDPETCKRKAEEIKNEFDQRSFAVTVVMDSARYYIESIDRSGTVLNLGKDSPVTQRNLRTINATVSVRQL